MINRRKFMLSSLAASSSALLSVVPGFAKKSSIFEEEEEINAPTVISTWDHGLDANEVAWDILQTGGRALDAVEKGVMLSESDPLITSVGFGGMPDRDGNVTLDACIMDDTGNAGSVAFLRNIKNPISVARLVMEKTPHVMLVGNGAMQFALHNGFKYENLLTTEARDRWLKWRKEKKYRPAAIDRINHDTIGLLALDKEGNLSGACTTSGLSWKLHGRVGDSPIIGAGLFVDNEVGAATATGLGEAVIKTAGTAIIVEQMRAGKSPQEACEIAIQRIVHKQPDHNDFQVGYLAINKKGETGGYAIHKNFSYALYQDDVNKMVDSEYEIQK